MSTATVVNLKWPPFLTPFTFSLPTLVVEHTFYTSLVRQTVQTSRVEYPLLPTATPWHSTQTRPVYPSRTPAQSLPLTPPSYPPYSLQLHSLPTSRPSGPDRRAPFGRSRSAQRTSCPWNTSLKGNALCCLQHGGPDPESLCFCFCSLQLTPPSQGLVAITSVRMTYLSPASSNDPSCIRRCSNSSTIPASGTQSVITSLSQKKRVAPP